MLGGIVSSSRSRRKTKGSRLGALSYISSPLGADGNVQVRRAVVEQKVESLGRRLVNDFFQADDERMFAYRAKRFNFCKIKTKLK